MGGGVLAGQMTCVRRICDVNLILEAGAGAMIFLAERVALTLEPVPEGWRHWRPSKA
jgi:hypothetical protein